jgi:energy-coupling factor transport system ATP-binding protein
MIRIESLSYRYPAAGRDALRSVSLHFAEGSFTAIIGANGSGKSTLARCLNGLLIPAAGRVLVDDMNTTDVAALPAIRRRVGIVFQDPNLQMTSPTIERELAFALQNIATPTEDIQRAVDAELQRLGLERRREDSPSSLSGGEKQRLALSCVMMLHPKYLVLDEPTTFLSPTSQQKLMEDLMVLVNERNVTLILITQYLGEATRAQRVVALQDGRVAFDDRPDAFTQQPRVLHDSGVIATREMKKPP